MTSIKKTGLITGSKGLIGTEIYKTLATKYHFYSIDRLITTDKDNDYFEVDISNYSKVEEAFNQFPKLDFIIHLAGDSNAETNWQSAMENNIHGTWNIYQAALKKTSRE